MAESFRRISITLRGQLLARALFVARALSIPLPRLMHHAIQLYIWMHEQTERGATFTVSYEQDGSGERVDLFIAPSERH